MANITIYLPDDVEQKARKAAKAAETSISKWVAAQVENTYRLTRMRHWRPPAFVLNSK